MIQFPVILYDDMIYQKKKKAPDNVLLYLSKTLTKTVQTKLSRMTNDSFPVKTKSKQNKDHL